VVPALGFKVEQGDVAAVFAAGLFAGYGIGRLAAKVGPAAAAVREIHETGAYQFTNPLLVCEGAAETIGDIEIRSFQHKIESLVAELKAAGRASQVSVYFRDMNNGPWFGVEVDAKFSPASLLKVPLMIALLRQAEQQPRFLLKQFTYDGQHDLNTFEVYKSEQRIEPGRSYSVDDLIFRMIAYSDNNPVGILAKAVDPAVLEMTYRDLNVPFPIKAFTDTLTVRSYASFFRILFNSSYLDRKMSEKALGYLNGSEFKDGIMAGLPQGLPLAHKFGETILGAKGGTRQLHDCGIVYYPVNPYLLCIMSKGDDFGKLSTTIRDISAMVYNEVDEQERAHKAAKRSD